MFTRQRAVWLCALMCVCLHGVGAETPAPNTTTDVQEHECLYCEPHTYCFVDVQHQCPLHSSAPAGSDDVADCVCHAGFYRVSEQCVQCEAGYYCPGSQLRLQCTADASSFTQSTGESDCSCLPGFTSEIGSCVACAPGTIKITDGNVACTPCAANAYALSTLACGACPALTQSAAGSASLTDCVARAGAFAEPGHPARLCPPGTYQDEANQTACKACPDNTYNSQSGAAQAAACVNCPPLSAIRPAGPGVAPSNCTCDAGHSGPDGGPCAPCVAGTYKSVTGSSCTDNFFINGADICAVYAQNPETYCMVTNAFGNRPLCSACCISCYNECCEKNGICPTSDYSVCQQCLAGSYAGAGSSACQACPAHSSSAAGSQALANCTCAAGYEAQADPFSCAACAAGSAKTAAANTACEMCAAGSFAPHSAMTACETCPADTFSNLGSAQCVNCSAHEFSTPGADSVEDCLCVAGFFRPAGFDASACAPCALGFFRNATHAQDSGSLACRPCPAGFSTLSVATVSADGCQPCPAGTYAADRGELGVACVQCGGHAQSERGTVGSCRCDAGFEPADEACKQCDFGYYKALAGNHSCTACAAGKQGTEARTQEATACAACPANTHWTAFGERCTACPAHSLASQGSVGASNCSCGTGFRYAIIAAGEYHDNTTWRDSEGYYCFQYVDMGWCLDREYGEAQDLLWSVSRDGPFASFAVDSVNAYQACYVCGGGLIAQVPFPACLPCEAGTYKPQVSNDVSCLLCAGKSYSHSAAATACEQCPAHSTGGLQNNASSDCRCDAGFTGPAGGPCEACAAGKFKTSQGEASCADCGPGAYWPAGADAAFFQCKACPGNSTRPTDLAHGILGCICDAGYRRSANDTCALCPAGSYCPEQYQQLSCPAHSYSSAGHATISGCECTAGFFGGAGNCSMCPPDTFCHSSSAAPAPCPANSTTVGQAGRTNVSACVCLGGFFREGDACRVCEPDSFCFGDTQLACPANSSAPPGADSLTDCMCHDGSRMQTGSFAECATCEASLICRGGVAQACAAGALNVDFRCVCPAGSYCPEAHVSCLLGACQRCPHNHWCLDNTLTACAANEHAPANSSRYSQCRCLDGFYRHLDGTCTECPLHHVCSNETRRAVSEFDPNLRTLTKRTVLLSQAVCANGFFRTAKTDLCKRCPVNFYCLPETTLSISLPNVVRCPENEHAQPGAYTRSGCLCAAGFKISTTEEVSRCLPCGPGERCQDGSVLQVECHLQGKAITADHSACVCEIGFGFLNFECHQCSPGFVKPEIGDTPCTACGINQYAANSTTCMPCPAHAQARPGSVQCTCAPPYVLAVGNDLPACVLCDPNHFWAQLGTAAGACSPCPAESSSQPSSGMQLGSDACRCAPGHLAAPLNVSGLLLCQQCAAGKFENAGECLACAENAWAPSGSQSRQACVCNSNATEQTCHSLQVDGSCAGQCAAPPPGCVPCVPGHFKGLPSSPGNADTCQACAEGHFQPAAAALFCEQCPLHEWHTESAAINRSQCLCVAGFTRPSEASGEASKPPCAACAAGHYKDWLGNHVCAPCAVARYQPHVNATVCNFCSDATLAMYLTGNISDESLFYEMTGRRPVLESNTTVSQASVSVLDCVCERGLEPRDVSGTLKCRPCVPGSFKEHKNHQHCTYCGASSQEHGSLYIHHFGAKEEGAVNSTHCLACPAFSGQDSDSVGPDALRLDDVTDCKCFPGHENRTAHSCSVCLQYMIQTNYSDEFCAFCPAGHFFQDRIIPCAACSLAGDGDDQHRLLVLNSFDNSLPWGASSDDCVCRLGYERGATDSCTACVPGKFRGSDLTRTCSQCPLDTYQDSTASLNCTSCPPNSSTVSAEGRTQLQDCVCGPGFQPLEEGLCLPCLAGTYRQARLANEATQACVQCPADHYCPAGAVLPSPCPPGELALPGSAELDHCLCPPGSGRTAGPAHAPSELSNPCRPCAHGSFAPERSNSECTPCPAHKNTSAVGASALADCTCVPGHGVHASEQHAACEPCLDGFFAPGRINAPCTHCGWGAITWPESGATSATNCQCSAILGLFKE